MFHERVHEHAVGHIGIVACVLSHGALGAPLADAYVDHVRLDGQPAGVTIDTRPTVFRDKSISQAAFAARAAQLPVV